MKMTVQTSNEEILKESLLDGMDLDDLLVTEGGGKTPEGKAIKVYGKLAGLNCIGRTNFIYGNEIIEKTEYANTQLMQKYGDEIYGKSAQANGGKGLIECNVSPLMQLPDKFVKEASDNAGQELAKFLKGFAKVLAGKTKDAEWLGKHKNANDLIKILNQINPAKGVDANKNLWSSMNKILKGEPWASEIKGNKEPFNVSAYNKINFFSNNKGKNLLEIINSEWTNFTSANVKSKSGDGGESRGNDTLGKGKAVDGQTWNPRQTYKIDIKTTFNDEWYKKKFKSGFLNKMIFAIKTDARSRSSPGGEGSMAGHKYTQDEDLLPQERRKLNSIKWKMTNKVAKDFVSLFCGWSRAKKEMYQEQDDNGIKYTPTEDCGLNPDKGFGDSMAKNALGGRGIFGRLKNAILSGGNDGSAITVAFQLDDPHNGWTIVEKKDAEGKKGEERKEGKGGGEEEKGGEEEGKEVSGESSSSPFGLSQDSPMLAPIKEASGNPYAQVKRTEDEVYGESDDPFYEDFMEERMELVKEICEGREDVYSLIEHCLLEG